MFRSLTQSVVVLAFAGLLATGCSGANTSSTPQDPASAAQRAGPNVVTSDVIANAGDVSIEKILADRVPGVRLDRTSDGSVALRIRGTSSWNTDTQPLYVVDGVALGQMSALTGINKSDIARIEVIKEGGRLAMYGSRGAGGVVLIAMKKP